MDAVLPRLHDLIAERATGVVWIRGGAPFVRLELVSGWIHAFSSIDPPADEDQLGVASRRKPPSDASAAFTALVRQASFRPSRELVRSDEPRLRLGATPPFHPTRQLREIAAAAIAELADFAEADALFAGVMLSVPIELHRSAIDPDEARIAALLVRKPVTIDELFAAGGTSQQRIRGLVRELALLGALRVDGKLVVFDLPGQVARARALAAERRRAYHAEARKVHPDLHPGAEPAAKAKLTDEMAELATRHKKNT